MTAILLLLLKAAVGVIIFAIGLDSTADDALFLPRRPGLLLRSLLAMYVVVPLAALMLVGMLDLAPGVELGLLVLAASAGAPLLPRKLLRIGDGAYTFSLVLLSSLLAIVVGLQVARFGGVTPCITCRWCGMRRWRPAMACASGARATSSPMRVRTAAPAVPRW